MDSEDTVAKRQLVGVKLSSELPTTAEVWRSAGKLWMAGLGRSGSCRQVTRTPVMLPELSPGGLETIVDFARHELSFLFSASTTTTTQHSRTAKASATRLY